MSVHEMVEWEDTCVSPMLYASHDRRVLNPVATFFHTHAGEPLKDTDVWWGEVGSGVVILGGRYGRCGEKACAGWEEGEAQHAVLQAMYEGRGGEGSLDEH